MASIAAACNIGEPLTTRRLSMLPVFEITASTTTVPSTCAAFAIGGYTGRIGASNRPADTPDDTWTGPAFFSGAAVIATRLVPTASTSAPGSEGSPNLVNVPVIAATGADDISIPCVIVGAASSRPITGTIEAIAFEACCTTVLGGGGGVGSGITTATSRPRMGIDSL